MSKETLESNQQTNQNNWRMSLKEWRDALYRSIFANTGNEFDTKVAEVKKYISHHPAFNDDAGGNPFKRQIDEEIKFMEAFSVACNEMKQKTGALSFSIRLDDERLPETQYQDYLNELGIKEFAYRLNEIIRGASEAKKDYSGQLNDIMSKQVEDRHQGYCDCLENELIPGLEEIIDAWGFGEHQRNSEDLGVSNGYKLTETGSHVKLDFSRQVKEQIKAIRHQKKIATGQIDGYKRQKQRAQNFSESYCKAADAPETFDLYRYKSVDNIKKNNSCEQLEAFIFIEEKSELY